MVFGGHETGYGSSLVNLSRKINENIRMKIFCTFSVYRSFRKIYGVGMDSLGGEAHPIQGAENQYAQLR